MSAQAFLPGTEDGWTSTHGSNSIRELRRARIICWARVADAESEIDSTGVPYFWGKPAPKGSWAALPKAQQEAYKQGVHAPQQRTLRSVALYAPKSLEVHSYRLWVALEPKTDLSVCAALQRTLGLEAAVDRAAAALSSNDLADLVRVASDFETLTRLVVGIRLAMATKNDARAFQLATATIKMLGLIAADPFICNIVDVLADILGKLVLNGLRGAGYVIRLRPEIFEGFQNALWDRLSAIEIMGGGIRRISKGPRLSLATRIDVIHPLAILLGTPGLQEHAQLYDMLDESMPRRSTRHCGSSSDNVLKQLEKHMLFEHESQASPHLSRQRLSAPSEENHAPTAGHPRRGPQR